MKWTIAGKVVERDGLEYAPCKCSEGHRQLVCLDVRPAPDCEACEADADARIDYRWVRCRAGLHWRVEDGGEYRCHPCICRANDNDPQILKRREQQRRYCASRTSAQRAAESARRREYYRENRPRFQSRRRAQWGAFDERATKGEYLRRWQQQHPGYTLLTDAVHHRRAPRAVMTQYWSAWKRGLRGEALRAFAERLLRRTKVQSDGRRVGRRAA
jgi:hypothetical protein